MPKETCCQRWMSIALKYVLLPVIMLPIHVLTAPFYRLHDKWVFEWFQNRRLITPATHRLNVERVQRQVKEWNSGGRKGGRLCTAKAAWNSYSMRFINKAVLTGIQVDHLTSVVDINETERTVTVEPGLMMGQLTSILLPRGWTIPVIPEFETLTVGGVICGAGIESGSTRAGLSSDTALEYEVVLSDGSVVTCSGSEHSDLFHCIPWSHGTLGFLTAVKFPLVPAKKWVRLEYHVTDCPAEARRLLETQDHEFVEGFAFGERQFVVTYGNQADEASRRRCQGTANHINRWHKHLFYKHVASFLSRPKKGVQTIATEFIPIRDYYHRHTRGYFWVAPQGAVFLTSRLFLFLFGWMLPMTDAKLIKRLVHALLPGRLYDAACNRLLSGNFVCQDFLLPLHDLEDALKFVHESVEVYPLWLCPTKCYKNPGLAHAPMETDAESELYVDVGIYGPVSRRRMAEFDYKEATKAQEAYTIAHAGFQFMYADSFLSPEEFRQMFDTSLYDQVRVSYGAAAAFPDVYDKVSKAARGLDVQDNITAGTPSA